MAYLDFKGKPFVYSHHLSVPFCPLQIEDKKSLSLKKKNPCLEDNLIIHGDNLTALKSLLPQYAGKIKLIYIDPPYNTGNEGWIYNDNVNSPLIKNWLKKVVDKEDLERHDKWLCMMWPRLQLMKELLSEDGVVFISIDDNEASSLKLILDEIFGKENFLTQVVVQLNPRGRTLDKHFAKTHEYILVYAKNSKENSIFLINKDQQGISEYDQVDKEGKYRLLELRNRNPEFSQLNRPNLFFPIYINPRNLMISLEKSSGFTEVALPNNSKGEKGCWTWGIAKVQRDIKLLVPKKVKTGIWRIFRKDYLPLEGAKTKAKCLWTDSKINNENGKEVLREIFRGNAPFNFPKSPDLIKKCVELSTKPNEKHLILDSFAGSGTTAHAVLSANKEDDGNRKFILIECEDYADKITAERVRRVIKGVPSAKDQELKKGLGGSFTYCTLGKPIELETLLKGKHLPSFEDLAKYVFFNATGKTLQKIAKQNSEYFIGETDRYRIHLVYQSDIKFLRSNASALNELLAKKIHKKTQENKKNLIFAANKFLSLRELKPYQIEYCQLPFALYKILG